MFDIVFYNNKSANNVLDKEIVISFTVQGSLREESSIINPEIIIEHSSYPNINYAYISEFKRYYYVVNVSSIRNNMWRISLKCDPLKSFSESIKSLTGVVSRNEFNYDLNIPDDRLITTPEKYTDTIRYGDGSTEFTPMSDNILALTNNS